MRRSFYISGAALAVIVATGCGALAWAKVAPTPAPIVVSVTSGVPVFTPRVAVAPIGRTVVFHNANGSALRIETAPHAPAAFNLIVPSDGSARLTLTRPGLYHYYDAVTARIVDYQAANDVVNALPGASHPDLPNQGWLIVPGPGGISSDDRINVPSAHDLFTRRAIVTHVGGSIVIHNHDTDAHNIVTDPADPTGAAFELLGTDGEPAIGGAERRITFTKPGLYHIYCSIHSRVVGRVGQWQVVVPRDSNASGYADRDPMDAWILVLQ